MQIIVFKNFSKRTNSTKQPADNTGTTINVELKANTSVEKPTFILSKDNDFLGINYIKAFGNYYKVDDTIILDNNRVEIPCTHDYLATYKSAVQNTNALILYAKDGDSTLIDNRIPLKTTPTITTQTASFRSDLVRSTPQNFTYMLTVVGENGCNTYATTLAGLQNIMPNIDNEWAQLVNKDSIEDTIFSVGKQIIGSGSVSQNIRDVRAIPFSALVGDIVTSIKIGYYTASMVGSKLTQATKLSVETTTINIPWQFNDWRDRLGNIYLYIPFIGNLSYPASELYGQTSISVTSSLWRPTGDLSVEVKCGDGSAILGTYGASTGSPVPLGSNNMSLGNIINGISQGAVAGFTGNMGMFANGVVNAVTPNHQSVGGIGNSSAVGIDLSMKCVVVNNDTVALPSTYASIHGYPYGKIGRVGSFTGFVQTQNASVNIAGRTDDSIRLNALLDAGIYIE